MRNRILLNHRVIQAAASALPHHSYVSPGDVLIGMGFLESIHLKDWKQTKIPFLECVLQRNFSKISFVMKCFRSWATHKGLNGFPLYWGRQILLSP